MEIKLENIVKNYGKFRALGPLSLNISQNGIITILGPNGAGKTTLLKVLVGLSKPSSGRIYINGKDFQNNRKEILKNMGVLVEQPEFYPYLTGREILEFSGKLKGLKGKNLEEEIKRVSEITGSLEFLDKKVGKYSRGMKQRLGIAVALENDPPIMILDEPTFGIDPIGSLEIREVLKNLNKNREKIIIFTTHIVEEASYLSDRIIILENGIIKNDTLNDSDYVLVKVTGNLINLGKYQEMTIKKLSDNQALIRIRKENLPDFNREITQKNDILFIERSSQVEEAIRELSDH